MTALALWCTRHRLLVIVAWTLVLLGLGAGFLAKGSAYSSSFALKGTDSSQAQQLLDKYKKLNAKVNLIPYNKVEDLPWVRPEIEVQEAFLAALEQQDVVATLRREKGHDIDAACGQLRLKTERELRSA